MCFNVLFPWVPVRLRRESLPHRRLVFLQCQRSKVRLQMLLPDLFEAPRCARLPAWLSGERNNGFDVRQVDPLPEVDDAHFTRRHALCSQSTCLGGVGVRLDSGHSLALKVTDGAGKTPLPFLLPPCVRGASLAELKRLVHPLAVFNDVIFQIACYESLVTSWKSLKTKVAA